MPKKFGTNSKSAEAKDRKEEAKKLQKESERKKKEEQLWADDDKSLKAKEDRKRESEEKKQKDKERKEENKRIADEEAEQLSKKNSSKAPPKKSRAEIEQAKSAAVFAMQAQVKKEEEDKEKELIASLEKDINPNHAFREEQLRLEEKGAELMEGRGIDEALGIVEGENKFKHPEKKVKQAWNLFVEENLSRAKGENPGLKRSQLMEVLRKEFEKSEKNPFNQNFLDYNDKLV